MPTGAPKVIAEPSGEPITLAEAKAQCRVTSDAENQLFHNLIQTAREMCEEDLGISVLQQTVEQALDHFPEDGCEIRLSRPPLRAVMSITYYGSDGADTLWSASEYLVDSDSFPARIVPKYGFTWPSAQLQPINGVKILFECGWPDRKQVPSRLKSGMLLIIGSLYKNRESEISGSSLASSTTVKLDADTQSAVDRLWKRYKRKL
jgi:uncharacterized phiE125 gp8 family phage protein